MRRSSKTAAGRNEVQGSLAEGSLSYLWILLMVIIIETLGR